MNSQRSSNIDVCSEQTEYKDKPCGGLKCDNSKTYLYQISLTIGSSFLCTDCKRSIERSGWTLQRIEYADNMRAKNQNLNSDFGIKNNVTNIKRINKDNRNSSKSLIKL